MAFYVDSKEVWDQTGHYRLQNIDFETFIDQSGRRRIRVDFIAILKYIGFTSRISSITLPDGQIDYFVDATRFYAIPDTNILRTGSSIGVGFIPGISDAKDIQETVTGYDLITGEELSIGDRVITGMCVFLPVINGRVVRIAKHGFTKVSNLVESALKLDDVGRAAFRSSVWQMHHFDRGRVIEEYLAQTEYKLSTTGWYNIGNPNFPVIDFQRGNNVISLKSIDPSRYTGDGATQQIKDYLETLRDQPIDISGSIISNFNKTLDIRVPPGMMHMINLNEFTDEYLDGVKMVLKEF